jgi:hypothetical protein
MSKMKITVIKRFHPKHVFGKDYVTPKGKTATECQSFKEDKDSSLENLQNSTISVPGMISTKIFPSSIGAAISPAGWKTAFSTPLALMASDLVASNSNASTNNH